MSGKLRIILIFLVIIADLYSFRQIRKGKMSLNHSLLWMGISLVLLLIALIPGIAFWITDLLGISTPVNTVFLFFGFFSIVLFVYLCNVVSKEDRMNRRLTQEIAILERKIRELENASKTGE